MKHSDEECVADMFSVNTLCVGGHLLFPVEKEPNPFTFDCI